MDGSIAAEIAFALALLALWAVVVRSVWRVWQPSRLLLAGHHADARVAGERLARSWLRIFPSIRRSARYAIACSLHLEGELEAALAALSPLHEERLRGDLRYAVCSIEAASLLLLDRDHAHAGDLLEEAARFRRLPEDALLAALAKHGLGEADAAARLFAEAEGGRPGAGAQQEAIFHTLRGFYLVKVGRATEAQDDFEIAAKSPITTVYVSRARAMLEARTTEADGPSSLAPQVVAKGENTSDR